MADGVRTLDDGSWNARYGGPDSRRYPRAFRPIKPITADNHRKLARLAINTSRLGAMPLKDVTRDDLAAWREALWSASWVSQSSCTTPLATDRLFR